MRTIRTTRRLSQGKQPLHAHLHRRRVYGTSASPGGALHTPEGDLATIGLQNKMPSEESPSRQWTGWRTNMLPRSSMRLPLDSCSDAAADAIEASAHRSHPRASMLEANATFAQLPPKCTSSRRQVSVNGTSRCEWSDYNGTARREQRVDELHFHYYHAHYSTQGSRTPSRRL